MSNIFCMFATQYKKYIIIMKQKWYKSRVMLYVIYATFYLALSKILSFEQSVICGLGAILGEMHYNDK